HDCLLAQGQQAAGQDFRHDFGHGICHFEGSSMCEKGVFVPCCPARAQHEAPPAIPAAGCVKSGVLSNLSG
ncbi:MAG: hypothetical protein ABJ201_19785, partial [Nisaea sp.]